MEGIDVHGQHAANGESLKEQHGKKRMNVLVVSSFKDSVGLRETILVYIMAPFLLELHDYAFSTLLVGHLSVICQWYRFGFHLD